MKVKILTIKSEIESAKNLGFTTETYYGDYAYTSDNDIVIRWGNSRLNYNKEGSKQVEFKNVINPGANIRTNCEKSKATKLLAQVVLVPTLYEKTVPAGVTAVVRPFEHSAGSGFSVKTGPFTLESGTYATKYLDVTKEGAEYRIWFCGNRTMAGRRVKMGCNPTETYPCRSKWGYSFCEGISKDIHNQTLLAAKKLGLDFGAADVLFSKGKWYFLELNTAPSVDHRIVREFFQKGLEILVATKFPKKEQILVPVVEISPVKKKELENVESNSTVETVTIGVV
jgi:hypothetical protein